MGMDLFGNSMEITSFNGFSSESSYKDDISILTTTRKYKHGQRH